MLVCLSFTFLRSWLRFLLTYKGHGMENLHMCRTYMLDCHLLKSFWCVPLQNNKVEIKGPSEFLLVGVTQDGVCPSSEKKGNNP